MTYIDPHNIDMTATNEAAAQISRAITAAAKEADEKVNQNMRAIARVFQQIADNLEGCK